jgi:hypothetical protein
VPRLLTRSPLYLVVPLVCAVLGTWSALARGNGRFPEAQAIVSPPPGVTGGAARTLYLRATFGVIVSRDGGTTWQWICEQTLGFDGTWDPPLVVGKDAELFIGLSDGIRTTTDGCVTTKIAGLDGELITDLTTDPTGAQIVALTATPSKPSGVVWIDAKSRKVERHGAVAGVRLETVEVAPSNPTRIYLTGVPVGAGTRAHLYTAKRGGELTELHPKLEADAQLLIAGIDPKNEKRFLIRALNAAGSDVLVTSDGGKTFKSVLHLASSMFGFAKSDDGSTYWAGAGDPNDGVWRSIDRGETWQPMAKVRVYCLHARGPDLFACSTPYRPDGFAVAVSHDGGKSFARLTGFDDIQGPVACAADAGSVCGARWPDVRATLVPQKPAAEAADAAADAPDASKASDAGDGKAQGTARACGCKVVGAEDSALPAPRWSFAGPVFLALVLAGRRRRWIAREPGPSRWRTAPTNVHPPRRG